MKIEARIDAFNQVREMPYRLPETLEEADTSCTCFVKSVKLAALLERGGLKVRHRLCRFSWSGGLVPEDVLENGPTQEDVHQFIEVFIPETEEWTPIDPTWDSPLAKAGFPIIEWDGVTPTRLAVRATEKLSPQESAKIIESIKSNPDGTKRYLESQQDFIVKFNNWLEEVRNS